MSVPSASPRGQLNRGRTSGDHFDDERVTRSSPNKTYQSQLNALVRAAVLAHRLDLADREECDIQSGCWGQYKPDVVVVMRPVTCTSILKDISKVTCNVANDIRGAEGSHWRRKREYGWPCQFMSDGALKVYFDKGYSYERFINEDEDKIYGWKTIPDAVVLKLSTDINQLLNTYGHNLMVLDPCPINDDGEVSISNTTHDARYYQDTPAYPFGSHTLLRRITRRLDDKRVIENLDLHSWKGPLDFTSTLCLPDTA